MNIEIALTPINAETVWQPVEEIAFEGRIPFDSPWPSPHFVTARVSTDSFDTVTGDDLPGCELGSRFVIRATRRDAFNNDFGIDCRWGVSGQFMTWKEEGAEWVGGYEKSVMYFDELVPWDETGSGVDQLTAALWAAENATDYPG